MFVAGAGLTPTVRAWAEDVPVRLDFARDGDSIVAAVHLKYPSLLRLCPRSVDAGPHCLDSHRGGQMLPVWYPAGAMQRDFYDPEATIFAYEGEVVLFSALPEQAVGKPYTVGLSMLLCSNRNCLPIDQSFTGVVPQSLPPVGEASWTGQWHKLKNRQPVLADVPDAPASAASAPKMEGRLAPPLGAGAPDALEGTAAARLAGQASDLLPPPEGFELQLTPRYADASLEISSLGKALLVGLVIRCRIAAPGGHAGADLPRSAALPLMAAKMAEMPRRFDTNLCFAGGVLTLFTGLARAGRRSDVCVTRSRAPAQSC